MIRNERRDGPLGRWRRARRAAALLLSWALPLSFGAASCKGDLGPSEGGSETHFLLPCETTCAAGTECVCGVCTTRCSDSTPCASGASTSSCESARARIAAGRCPAEDPEAFCDALCLADEECAPLGQNYQCRSGYCRAGATPATPEGGSAAASCTPPGVGASDLLVLGDSHIYLTQFASYLEQQAIGAGALADGEHFRVRSSYMTSMLAEGTLSIAGMYESARQEGPLRVVVMDGGETDMFQPMCDSEPHRNCPAVQTAVRGAQDLLSQMAQDGVERVFYFFYPNPIGNSGLQSNLDTLRPLLQNACGNSPVACQWVDTRPRFADHPEYLAADGVLLSEEGAQATATLLWERMQAPCMAP